MYVAPVESSVLPLAAREFLMLSPVTMAWDGFCSGDLEYVQQWCGSVGKVNRCRPANILVVQCNRHVFLIREGISTYQFIQFGAICSLVMNHTQYNQNYAGIQHKRCA